MPRTMEVMSFTITPETKKAFIKLDTFYNKSAIVESLIIEFLERAKQGKGNPQSPLKILHRQTTEVKRRLS